MAASGSTVAVRSSEVSLIIEAPPVLRQRTHVTVSLVAALLLTGAIYALPWIAASSGNRAGLPAIFGADFYAYLNFSHVFTVSGFPDHDPWYGVPIQPKFGHSTFRGAFVLFGVARSVFGSDVATSIVWSIGWSVLIACSLWLLLRTLFEEASALFLFAGTSMIVFFTLSTLKINAVGWLHLLSGSIRDDLPLPFIRMFFPQIAVPLLAFYFFCCKKAWDHGHARDLLALLLIQIATFLSFPYGSVFLGMATFIFLLLMVTASDWRKRVLQFAVMGVASLLADGLYLWRVLPHSSSGDPGPQRIPLFHLDLTQLRTNLGGSVVLLLACAIFLLVSQRKHSSRLLIVSIGLANVLMLLADCIIDPRLLVSHHAGYFVQISLGLELCGVCYWARNFLSPRLFKIAAAAASIFFVCNGALASWAAVRANADTNTRDASFAAVINRLNLTSEDLVVAPAKEVDDVSTAVPLLSRAHVLYTPEAEILLGQGDESLMNERHATYLYLSGRDSNWVDSQLARNLLPTTVLTLGQRFDLQYHRRPDLLQKQVRQNLLRELRALDNGVKPPVLTGSRRVIILDDIDHSTFDGFHVKQLLKVSEDYKIGSIRVRVCSAAGKV
jgi:hypothetical protein